MKKSLRLLMMALTAVILILAVLLPITTYAGNYAEPYTATLRYYDDIQITYTLNYPMGGIWSGSADIPIGGMGGADQVYCVDPFVPFHSLADQTYWDRITAATLDVKGGYAAAAPWNMSAAMRQNLDAVKWLAQNGYRGDYLEDDSVSRASVARLSGLYPGIGDINKKIALMATKVAMWKIIAGQSVDILRTSLDAAPAAKNTFSALTDALVSDAKAGRATGLDATGFEITINDNHVSEPNSGGYMYYGPLTVTAELKESTGNLYELLDKVFLSANGESSSGIDFIKAPNASADSISAGKPAEKLYGSDEWKSYLDIGDFTLSGGNALESIPFYLKIPDGRISTDMLTVKAYAMAAEVPLVEGTPVVFVNEGSGGIQDWNAVQAFIGGVNDGMEANLYAEASANTCATPLGQIYVSKVVENGSPIDDDTLFYFQLFCGDTPGFADNLVDLNDYPVYGAIESDPATGVFALKNGGLAMFERLPADWHYRVKEIGAPGYSAYFEINIAAVQTGRTNASETDEFQMDEDMALVTFYNVKDAPKARFYVEKLAMAGFDFIMGAPFHFQIESFESGAWQPVALTDDIFKSDRSEIVDGINGIFALETREMAFFELDLTGDYRITELNLDTDTYIPMYLYIFYPDDGSAPFVMDMGGGSSGNWGVGGDYAVEVSNLDTDGKFLLGFINQNIMLYDLSINKTVIENAPSDSLFQFKIICIDDSLGAPNSQYPWIAPISDGSVPYTFKVEITGAIDVSARIAEDENGDCVLLLKHGETATIKGLPAGTYKIIEGDNAAYETKYAIGSGGDACDGKETVEFLLSENMLVTFANTKPAVLEAETNETTTAPTQPTTTSGNTAADTEDETDTSESSDETSKDTTEPTGGSEDETKETESDEEATEPTIDSTGETSQNDSTNKETAELETSGSAETKHSDFATEPIIPTEPTIGTSETVEIESATNFYREFSTGMAWNAVPNIAEMETKPSLAGTSTSTNGKLAEKNTTETSSGEKIPIQNGWSAEHIGDGIHLIYDENGTSLGYVKLDEGENISEWKDYGNIAPLWELGGKWEKTEKENPKTGNVGVFVAFVLFCISGTIIKKKLKLPNVKRDPK